MSFTMKLYYCLFTTLLLSSCGSINNTSVNPIVNHENNELKEGVLTLKQSDTLFSFAFVGCNRVDRQQEFDTTATNESTANLVALKRVFNEVSELKNKPELFFFLGDLVLAESTTAKLNSQLKAWDALYEDKTFSKISTSGIEMVALPGNHEMLYYQDFGVADHDEWPLKGATELWMEHMAEYMPKDRTHITGPDSIVNQMTYSIIRHNVGFVIMNTDTYNEPTTENPYGLEGMIPTQWIINKVNEFQANPTIDHIFVLGHKPYYVNGNPETGHQGLPAGPILWTALNKAHVNAMLSAHVHDYQREQPGDQGTYQIIAGNGGSKGEAIFFGYTMITILRNGDIQLTSLGFEKGDPYYSAIPNNPTFIRDSTILSWTKNANPYSSLPVVKE